MGSKAIAGNFEVLMQITIDIYHTVWSIFKAYIYIAMDDDGGYGLKRLFIAAMLIVAFYIVGMRVVPLLPEAYLPIAKKSIKVIAGFLFVGAGIFVYHSSKPTSHGR